ncbi:Peptidyl-prolyl cis-trans isomerase cyp10 [Termitomyces sp. Mi166|nr:Peptidyl-prolyl cis-trans isomerase cyp10 [Termitomyces sp. Mi166\
MSKLDHSRDINVTIKWCLASTLSRVRNNFLALCASNYYDGCIFHRNIKGFMIQTGDPTGQGKGGQSIWGKPFSDEVRSTLKFNARGVVAMANSGPDTNKSQFFITYSKQPHLDGKYTILGKVIDGADSTLDAMEKVPVTNKNRPLTEIKLTHVQLKRPSFTLY